MTPSEEFIEIQRALLEHAREQTRLMEVHAARIDAIRKLFSQWGWGIFVGFMIGVLLMKT